MKIKNYFEFTDKISSSGQPNEEQFKEIASRGFSTVINLAMPDSDHVLTNEGRTVTALGMDYIHIPVPFDAPSVDHLNSFTGYMNALGGKKVWVHCVVNARVSAFLHIYLQKEKGFSAADSTSPLLKIWREEMDDIWRKFIDQSLVRIFNKSD